jgi:hypothetical protein
MKGTWLFVLLLGCGSSSSPDAGSTADGAARADARGSGGQGTMTWKYDGTLHAATSITTMHRKDAIIDLLELIAVESSTDGVGIIVTDLNPNDTTMITGTYQCPGTNVIEVEMTYSATGANSPMSCTVTITQPGMAGVQNAVGTFEAVLSNGKAVTEGMFDTPIGTIVHLP